MEMKYLNNEIKTVMKICELMPNEFISRKIVNVYHNDFFYKYVVITALFDTKENKFLCNVKFNISRLTLKYLKNINGMSDLQKRKIYEMYKLLKKNKWKNKYYFERYSGCRNSIDEILIAYQNLSKKNIQKYHFVYTNKEFDTLYCMYLTLDSKQMSQCVKEMGVEKLMKNKDNLRYNLFN